MLKFVGGNTETTAIIIIIIIISNNNKINKNLQKLYLWVLEKGSRKHALTQTQLVRERSGYGRNHTGLEIYRAQE